MLRFTHSGAAPRRPPIVSGDSAASRSARRPVSVNAPATDSPGIEARRSGSPADVSAGSRCATQRSANDAAQGLGPL
ncbi:hypothetical protein ACWD3J_39735 [Streptomyces sp. NPDC002755]